MRGEPRVDFNPRAHIDRYADQLQDDFKRVTINRSLHGGDSGDFMNMGRQFHTTDRPSFLFGEAMPE